MNYLSIMWDVNPIFIELGSIKIAYYGLLWAAAFITGIWLLKKIVAKENLNPDITDSIFMYVFIATIIGARLGHTLFYDFDYYSQNPLSILKVWEGGLASHGAAIGIIISLWLFSKKWKMPYIWVIDRIGIVGSIGGAIIRLGNLMNSEIYGTQTELPWGFIFKQAGETLPMHPTQLYEALAYIILFALLSYIYWRTKLSDKRGFMFGVFLIILFGSRFFIEMVKNPQVQFEQSMTLLMGQWLSIPFILAGIILLIYALKSPPRPYLNMPTAQPVSRTQKRHSK